METLSYLALLLGCAFGALLLFRQREPLVQRHKTVAHLYTLSSAFIATYAMLKLVTDASVPSSATLQLFFQNLSYFIALPLIASLLFATSIGRFWERNYWGRWMLFLFALFELTRRAGYGAEYSTWLSLAAVLALFASFAKQGLPSRVSVSGLISSLLIGLSLYFSGQMSALETLIKMDALHIQSFSAFIFSAGLIGLGYATGKFIAQTNQPTSEE